MPDRRTATARGATAGEAAGRDAEGRDAAVRFRAVQEAAACTFARRSRLVGMPAHDGPDAYAAGRAVVPELRRFAARAAADRLDGFVVELTDPAHGATVAAVARTTRLLLAGLLAADGDEAAAGLDGAGGEHWWFRACGTRWFVLAFAPAYGPDSPRHTFGSPSTFLLLQPVEAFDRHATPRGTVIPQAVREDVRDRYAAGGRPYDAALAAQEVEALKFVWPAAPGDAPVAWWHEGPLATPAAAGGGVAPEAPAGGVGGAARPVAEEAAAAALHHAASPPASWDAFGALLEAAGVLGGAAGQPVDRETVRGLVGGLAGLGLDGPFRRVGLYTARPDVVLPDGLRPAAPHGAPEEDVFRLALAAACPGEPWPAGPADGAVLADAVRVLGGRLGCRVPALAAVAALHLLRGLASADAAGHRRILRRLAWLGDPRTSDAAELMRRLTGPDDPLVRLPEPASAAPAAPVPGAVRGTDDDEEPLPLADWRRPPPAPGEERRLGGRVRAVRRHRGRTFADLSWAEETVQLALDGRPPVRVRPGDLLAVRGRGGRTRTGAPVLFVDEVLRHRPARSPRSALRGAAPAPAPSTPVVHGLRPRLAALGFLEMSSPVLAPGFYGGSSRPFTTRQAAGSRPLYLRVTTELDLVRRIAEGRTRVYEIGPSFRNEALRGGAAKEFPMLEAYAADLRMEAMADLVAGLVADVLDDPRPARWTTFDEAFAETSGVRPDDAAGLRRLADRHGGTGMARTTDPEALAQRLWRATFRYRMRGVALVHRIPGPASPFIAGEGRDARRVWLSVDGVELAEVSANERDPDRLARRLAAQFRHDPHPVHRDYRDVLEAFADGVPPCVGVGLGLTRLAGLLRPPATRPARTRLRPDTPEEYPQP
ncbi:hypothetical protein EF903_07460 [Streptomyces sp. WAC05292]|uniref:amino acid--tRNA ligase-related protein n=1 Tax=Streptomyces sp. WAC05292 TaxID=2487418 RepID=UPI000F737E8E|nr:amino acid--tRNA ligase-related protein [Streptomyces sp. WAC05292]RSS93843.1 hypothetical protein EF903_07460 [Streptomyces sp. WAC05292]